MCANVVVVMNKEDAAMWRDIFNKQRKDAEQSPEERMNRLMDNCQSAGFVCTKISGFEFFVMLNGVKIANVVFLSTEFLFAVRDQKSNDTTRRRFGNAETALEYILSLTTLLMQLRTQCHNRNFYCETISPSQFSVRWSADENALVMVTVTEPGAVSIMGLPAEEYQDRERFINEKTFQDVGPAMRYIYMAVFHPLMTDLVVVLQPLLIEVNEVVGDTFIIARQSPYELWILIQGADAPSVLVRLVGHDTISVEDTAFKTNYQNFEDVRAACDYIRNILLPPTGPDMQLPVNIVQLLHERVLHLEARMLGKKYLSIQKNNTAAFVPYVMANWRW